MKHYLIISGLFCCLIQVSYGQDSIDFFFKEFNVSVNRTTLQGANSENRYGFGLGAYHSLLPDKKINIVFGFEYNRTSQYIKFMYEGHFAHATDLTYNINCFSVPLGFRLNIGSKKRLFVETGGYVDLMINSNRVGTMHTYSPDENNQINYTKTEIDEKVQLSNAVGLYVGLGVLIPISKIKLIIKPDYKFGINELYSYQDVIFNRYFRINIGIKIN